MEVMLNLVISNLEGDLHAKVFLKVDATRRQIHAPNERTYYPPIEKALHLAKNRSLYNQEALCVGP